VLIWFFVELFFLDDIFFGINFLLSYVLVELFFGRCLRVELLRLCYRTFHKILRLEIGIDGFGVKKHIAS